METVRRVTLLWRFHGEININVSGNLIYHVFSMKTPALSPNFTIKSIILHLSPYNLHTKG